MAKQRTKSRIGRFFDVTERWLPLVWVTLLILFFTVFGGLSCTARLHDVSHQPPYAERVNQVCVLRRAIYAHGVAEDAWSKQTSHVRLTDWGIQGRQVMFEAMLPVGERMVIKQVHRCWNCFFDDVVEYTVELPGQPQWAAWPVLASQRVMGMDAVSCSPG